MNVHDFCRLLLRDARAEARTNGVELPKRITALRSMSSHRAQFFIEADGVRGEYFEGCCAYECKAKYVRKIIDKQNPTEATE